MFDVSNCKLQVHFKQKSIIDNLDTLELNFFLQIGVTSSVLFVWSVIRYHNTREVATHKEPGKDKGRAQHRGTMARRETAAGR